MGMFEVKGQLGVGQIRANITRGAVTAPAGHTSSSWKAKGPSHASQLRIGHREIEVQFEHVDARLAKNAERTAGRVASDYRRDMIRR
jgi:hypothetical protein